jgi:hypothetical protein
MARLRHGGGIKGGDQSGALLGIFGQLFGRPCTLAFGLKLGKALGKGFDGHGAWASCG